MALARVEWPGAAEVRVAERLRPVSYTLTDDGGTVRIWPLPGRPRHWRPFLAGPATSRHVVSVT